MLHAFCAVCLFAILFNSIQICVYSLAKRVVLRTNSIALLEPGVVSGSHDTNLVLGNTMYHSSRLTLIGGVESDDEVPACSCLHKLTTCPPLPHFSQAQTHHTNLLRELFTGPRDRGQFWHSNHRQCLVNLLFLLPSIEPSFHPYSKSGRLLCRSFISCSRLNQLESITKP